MTLCETSSGNSLKIMGSIGSSVQYFIDILAIEIVYSIYFHPREDHQIF